MAFFQTNEQSPASNQNFIQLIIMKKTFLTLAIAAMLCSCNNTATPDALDSDSARAAVTADSLAAEKALADTSDRYEDSTTIKIDSSKKKLAADSTK